jgi:hypothetical protein
MKELPIFTPSGNIAPQFKVLFATATTLGKRINSASISRLEAQIMLSSSFSPRLATHSWPLA